MELLVLVLVAVMLIAVGYAKVQHGVVKTTGNQLLVEEED